MKIRKPKPIPKPSGVFINATLVEARENGARIKMTIALKKGPVVWEFEEHQLVVGDSYILNCPDISQFIGMT